MTDRAVVLAAGRGSRLGDLTSVTPKPLLDVAGKPVIQRVLEGIAAARIFEVAVITGHMADQIEDRVWGMAGLSIEFIRQQKLDGTGAALALAREFVKAQRFFFTWGDILVDPANYLRMLESASWADAVLAVNHVDDPSAGAAVYVNDELIVTAIEEKPPPGTATTNWNNAGFGVLGASIWNEIDALERSPRGEFELPDALRAMIDAGAKVQAVPVVGEWFDVGTPASLQAARRHYRELDASEP